MNKVRRARVDEVIERLQELQSEIEDILREEYEYRDNIPENMQQSEKYETADSNCNCLQNACDSIDECIDQLGESKA